MNTDTREEHPHGESAQSYSREQAGHSPSTSRTEHESDAHLAITKLWMRLDEQQKQEFLADVRVANPDLWLRTNNAALDATTDW